ncbi:MAG: sulfatase-like hydrolase/transferase [Chloroflexi bacterium]|nr:sulfatase-like hydrolase/transferase [Chloroflexota bacterium]
MAKGTPASNQAGEVAPAAVQFLQGPPPQPFFLSVGFTETHRPYPLATEREDPRCARPPVTLPDTPDTRQDMANFEASARRLDDAVGTVLRGLEASGLAANTLVVCTTDHGIAFPGMKCTLTDHGIGVLLIVRGPEPFSGGKVSDALASQVDLFPTLCEWLCLPPPAWLQGKSLMPLLRGSAAEVNDEIFAQVNYHAAYRK